MKLHQKDLLNNWWMEIFFSKNLLALWSIGKRRNEPIIDIPDDDGITSTILKESYWIINYQIKIKNPFISALNRYFNFHTVSLIFLISQSLANKVRATYNHDEYLQEHIIMMQEWSNYLDILQNKTTVSHPKHQQQFF